MALKIDLGLKTYDIEDADGNLVGAIRFNPADPGLAGRWESVEKVFDEFGDLKEMTPAKAVELDRTIKDRIDYALGSKVSDVVFAGMSCFALCADGHTVLENVMTALRPIIETEMQKAIKASEKHLTEYTAGYEGTAAGLAPGQQA